MKKGTDFLEKMKRNDFILFRKYVVHGILKTDMSEHMNMTKTIKFKVEKEKDFIPDEEDYPENFLDFFGLLIHTCDIYAPVKCLEIGKVWADRINQEMMDQYEHETKLEIPLTPYFKGLDNIQTRAKGEGFFIEKIVTPLWGLLNTILEDQLSEMMDQLSDTRELWRKVANGEAKWNEDEEDGDKGNMLKN